MRYATTILALLFAFALFAQKSQQVRNYLGEYRYTKGVPKEGAEVSFIFTKRVLGRTADGKKTFQQLLPSSPYYTDGDDAGDLIGITIGVDEILPQSKREAAKTETRTPTLPSTEPAPAPSEYRNMFAGLPDSNRLEQLKREHRANKAKEWASIKPYKEYLMWRFYQLMLIVVGLAGMLWLFAKASASDAITDMRGHPLIGNAITSIHIFTKTALFCLLAVPSGIIIINDVVTAYYTEEFSLVWVLKYGFIILVWYTVLEWVIPDTPGASNKTGNYQFHNQQRLGP